MQVSVVLQPPFVKIPSLKNNGGTVYYVEVEVSAVGGIIIDNSIYPYFYIYR